jgi:hypothetical protein
MRRGGESRSEVPACGPHFKRWGKRRSGGGE